MMQLELPVDETVAVVYNKAGEVVDRAYCWETGQTYAQAGYTVIAIADNGIYWTRERAQELYDNELECFRDCFGSSMVH